MADTNQTLTGSEREPIAFDDRTRRVMELRKQIREGLYRPAAEEVATALLRDWTALAMATRERPLPAVDANPDAQDFAGRFVIAPTGSGAAHEEVMTA